MDVLPSIPASDSVSSRSLTGTFDSKQVEVDDRNGQKGDGSMIRYKDPMTYSKYLEQRRSAKMERSKLLSEASLRCLDIQSNPPNMVAAEWDDSNKSTAQLADELYWANQKYQNEAKEVEYQRGLVAKLVKHFSAMEKEITDREAEILELRKNISALMELLAKLRKQDEEKTPPKRQTRGFTLPDSSPKRVPWMRRFVYAFLALGVIALVLGPKQFTHWTHGIKKLACPPTTQFQPNWEGWEGMPDGPADMTMDVEMPEWLELLLRKY